MTNDIFLAAKARKWGTHANAKSGEERRPHLRRDFFPPLDTEPGISQYSSIELYPRSLFILKQSLSCPGRS